MVCSSYLLPAGAGTNARTHTHANTQLAQMDHRRANPKGPCAPRRKIYAHTEGPSCGSGDQAYSKPLISFPLPDDNLTILSLTDPRTDRYLQQSEGKRKMNMCVSSQDMKKQCASWMQIFQIRPQLTSCFTKSANEVRFLYLLFSHHNHHLPTKPLNHLIPSLIMDK